MHYLVMGDAGQVAALQQTAPHITWQVVDAIAGTTTVQTDAFFYLVNNAAAQDWRGFDCPIFANTALGTLDGHNAKAMVGINGWPFFLLNPHWELTGNISPAIQQVLESLGKTAIAAPNQPGLISARVIAMVINEAYFALEDGVSSREDIDTAMKLGTNYPHGPFEWAGILGLKNIHQLLDTLCQTDERCIPAPLLKKEALA